MNDQAAQNAVAAADAAHDSARRELEALVRIPSISADRDHFPDVRASAEHTAELLRSHGLENVRITGVEGSQPFVLGEWMHAGPDAPTVLLYAHHDVQPPGEVANWASDPFAPEEREGRLYGRGSADDKAGAVAHAHAVGAWLRTAGELPCNVRVLIEGEEEIGSPTLQAVLDVAPRRAALGCLGTRRFRQLGRRDSRAHLRIARAGRGRHRAPRPRQSRSTPAWSAVRCPIR